MRPFATAVLLLLSSASWAIKPLEPSIKCSLPTTTPVIWQRFENELFSIQIPPTYEFRAVESVDSLVGKWVEKTDRPDRASINFIASKRDKTYAPAEECSEEIGGGRAITSAGIGPSGRYFVRAKWPDRVGPHSWQVMIWADTPGPAAQAEAFAALRSVLLKGKRDDA